MKMLPALALLALVAQTGLVRASDQDVLEKVAEQIRKDSSYTNCQAPDITQCNSQWCIYKDGTDCPGFYVATSLQYARILFVS